MSAMKIMLMLHKSIRSKGKCHIAFKMSLLWNEWPKFFLQATFGAHDVVTQHHFSLLITQDKLTNSTQRLLFYATDTHIHTLIPKPFFTGSKAKQKKKSQQHPVRLRFHCHSWHLPVMTRGAFPVGYSASEPNWWCQRAAWRSQWQLLASTPGLGSIYWAMLYARSVPAEAMTFRGSNARFKTMCVYLVVY